jgi:SRSO17 transposase
MREEKTQILSAQELALALPPWAWKGATWREGIRGAFSSLLAAVRVRCAFRENQNVTSRPEEWLLIDWPRAEAQPARYWLSTLPSDTPLPDLVKLAKHSWIVERDSLELNEDLGLAHYEGRGWRGVHHHAALCIAAYGFLVAERNAFSPLARVGRLELPRPEIPRDFRPCGLAA